MWHTKSSVWRWKVEPGMGDAFDDLLGWMLSSQRDTEIETAAMSPGNSPSQRFRPRPLWSHCCGTAYRAA